MQHLYLILSITCWVTAVHGQSRTFSDYSDAFNEYELRQLSYTLEEGADTLLGRCVDSILTNNLPAVVDLAQRAIDIAPDQPLGYFMRGLAEMDLDRPAAALGSMDTAILLAPDFVTAYVYKGKFYAQREEYDLAEAVFVLAAERIPTAPQPPFWLGVLALRKAHLVRARKLWEESVVRDACYVPARIAILWQRMQAARLTKGMREVQELLHCDELSPTIYYLLASIAVEEGDYQAALFRINSAINLSPESVKFLYYRAKVHGELADYPAAVNDLYLAYAARSARYADNGVRDTDQSMSSREMVYALNYFRYGGSFTGEHSAAYSQWLYALQIYDRELMADAEKHLLKQGQDSHPGFLYFSTLAEHRDFATLKATPLPLLDQALAADPNLVDLYRIRGQRLLTQGDHRGAYAAFREVSNREPDNIDALKGMGGALLASDNERAAVHMYHQVLERDSTDTEMLIALGDFYFRTGKYSTSSAYYERILDQSPRHALALHQHAICSYLLGQSERAITNLHLIPANVYAMDPELVNLRGLVRYSLDSLTAANTDFNTAIAQDPAFLDAYLNRARVSYAEGRYDTALRELDYLVEKRETPDPYVYALRAQAKAALRDESACDDMTQAETLGYLPKPGEKETCCP